MKEQETNALCPLRCRRNGLMEVTLGMGLCRGCEGFKGSIPNVTFFPFMFSKELISKAQETSKWRSKGQHFY